ncbi:MAG TPA: hypothetical protein VMG60_13275 [Burkholderiaceae bacterium]|nr:hypothetical protein [Burkholderiaceae bacterium]
MSLIHLAGEMAVWSEEQWAAYEGKAPRPLWMERQRERLARRREHARSLLVETFAWTLLVTSVVLLFLH